MAEERRSYRPTPAAVTAGTTPVPAAKPFIPMGTPAPMERKEPAADGDFINLGSFYPSRSGKAQTFFVKPETAEKLKEIAEGDVIGISNSEKSGRVSLWTIRKG